MIDGYIQYHVLKENNIKKAFVKVFVKSRKCWNSYKTKMTTYIYGIHLNQKQKKQYIWRIPKLCKGWTRDLLHGNKILVNTKYAISPITITKIQRLDKCSVNFSVKKVVRKTKK